MSGIWGSPSSLFYSPASGIRGSPWTAPDTRTHHLTLQPPRAENPSSLALQRVWLTWPQTKGEV